MLAGYDVVLISTDHSDYDYDWIVRHTRLVIDAHNATSAVRGAAKKSCLSIRKLAECL